MLLTSVPAHATRRFAISKSALKRVARPVLAVEAKSCCPRLSFFYKVCLRAEIANNKAVSVRSLAKHYRSSMLRCSLYTPLFQDAGAFAPSTSRASAAGIRSGSLYASFLQDVFSRPFGVGRSLVRKLFAFAVDVFFGCPPTSAELAAARDLQDAFVWSDLT